MPAMDGLTIHRARRVRTLDRSRPVVDAVASAGGRIVATGTLDELARWGDGTVDDTFADAVLVPGFVEAHSHVFEGGMWAFEYVGAHDRTGPDGVVRPACRTLPEVVERLRVLDAGIADPTETLIVWGFDPILLDDHDPGGERLGVAHLDAVSETRPIFVFHASGHLATVNTALAEAEGFADGVDVPGVPTGADGRILGELQEPAAMSLARTAFFRLLGEITGPPVAGRLGALALASGTTTLTDLGTIDLSRDAAVDGWLAATADPEAFPARLDAFWNPTLGNNDGDLDAVVARLADLRARSTDRLRMGSVKLVLDGSIQGFTARVGFPGYLDGRPNGLWLLPPERFEAVFGAVHRSGGLVHVHCNGDEATELFCDVLERLLAEHPRPDHRHTVQHGQLTTPAQLRRLAALGACVNLFANHLWYWGDQHHDLTVGPDRAARIDPCGSALAAGVPLSIHSDASITPLGHLHTMWCAVNRVTPSGRVLGPEERITPEQALHAATLGAAHQLHLDDELGSVEAGKACDLTALAEDPLEVDPMAIRDVGVLGTVVGGRARRR